MKVLYFCLDVGSGIEEMGRFKIEILRRFSGISKIVVYNTQCSRIASEEAIPFVEKYNPDIIIFEENDVLQVPDLSRHSNCPIIMIKHGTVCTRNDCSAILTHVWSEGISGDYRYMYLPCSPGNIFKNEHQTLTPQGNNVLIVSRPYKFTMGDIEKALQLFQCDKIDAYFSKKSLKFSGHDTQFIIEKYFNHKGFISKQEMAKVYAEYDFMLIPTIDECLCLPLREALMSGVLPIICSFEKYYSTRCNFANEFLKYVAWIDKDDKSSLSRKLVTLRLENDYIMSYLSLEKMILHLLMYLRCFALKDLKWNGKPIVDVEEFPQKDLYDPTRHYTHAVDWDAINL